MAATQDEPATPDDPDADARALASALRLRILRMCLDEALTNREIADRLGRNPATVLHHVRTLVDRDFLAAQPVRRGTRGAREVPYLATRRSWRVRGLDDSSATVEAFAQEVALVDPTAVWTVRLGLRLDGPGLDELRERLAAVLQDFAAREPTVGGQAMSVFLAVHEDANRPQ